MNLDRYNADDAPLIKSWLELRGMHNEHFVRDLPRTGVMCRIEDNPICAGFLRYVEGNFAMLDSLVTNPKMKSFTRNVAIDAVVKELISIAKRHGIKKILAFSVDEGILKRSIGHGFIKTSHEVIALKLDEPQMVLEGI